MNTLSLASKFYYDENSPSCLSFCGQKSGKKWAGWDGAKYYYVYYEGKEILAHRVVWQLHYGEIPNGSEIDHIDGDRYNNKVENLRLVSPKRNKRNSGMYKSNTSGVVGVTRVDKLMGDKLYQYWRAHWVDLDSKKRFKVFSIAKHGYDEAFRLACEYRECMMLRLNEAGAGYTNRHLQK